MVPPRTPHTGRRKDQGNTVAHRHIGVLIDTSRAFGRGVLNGVARYHREHEPWTFDVDPAAACTDLAPPWLTDFAGDGLIVALGEGAVAEAVRAAQHPSVDLTGAMRGDRGADVVADAPAIARLAADHLLERGYQRFAYCPAPRGVAPSANQLGEHFAACVEAAGREHAAIAVADAQWFGAASRDGAARLGAWVAGVERPVGVLCADDAAGHDLLRACRNAAIHVPDELAVVSVGNDAMLCVLTTPPLTSIDLNAARIGYEAAALLDRRIDGGAATDEPIRIEPRRLVTRGSTDTLAIDDPALAAAVRFIRDHACRPISVEDVLEHVMISRSVLERRFKQSLRRSPKSEITRVQLERAKALLTETDLPLTVIADKAGFSSAKYFTEVFHRKLGAPPTQYRAASRRLT